MRDVWLRYMVDIQRDRCMRDVCRMREMWGKVRERLDFSKNLK